MTEIVASVQDIAACTREIDDAAARMDEIVWPTIFSAAMLDSAVRRVVVTGRLEAECRRLAADLRSWTATVRVAVAATEQSDLRAATALS